MIFNFQIVFKILGTCSFLTVKQLTGGLWGNKSQNPKLTLF